MANIKAALKDIRKNQKRRLHNSAVTSELKTLTKKYHTLLGGGQKQEAENLLRLLARKFDVAASRGILHPNTASRKKSRLMKKFTIPKVAA